MVKTRGKARVLRACREAKLRPSAAELIKNPGDMVAALTYPGLMPSTGSFLIGFTFGELREGKADPLRRRLAAAEEFRGIDLEERAGFWRHRYAEYDFDYGKRPVAVVLHVAAPEDEMAIRGGIQRVLAEARKWHPERPFILDCIALADEPSWHKSGMKMLLITGKFSERLITNQRLTQHITELLQ